MNAKVQPFIKGMVIEWYRPIDEIPSGWALCDGNNGTPNLLDRFIVGAGNTYAVGDTGGAADHSHIVEMEPHSHEIVHGDGVELGNYWDVETTLEELEGEALSTSNIPPYHALAYIMKL